MVNPVEDSYSKTLNYWKIIRKTQKSNSLLKTKSILKLKYKLSGVRFHLACQGGGNSLLCPPSVTSLAMIYCIHIQ